MSIVAIHIYFSEEVKLCSIFYLGKLFDLFVGPWLLASKLVAWESQDPETLGFCQLVVQSLQLFVVFVGEPSFRSDVHYQANVVSVFLEGYIISVYI